MKVKEMMTSPVIHAGPDTSRAAVAESLVENQVSAVLIVDEDGGVVGIVSEHDLLASAGQTARDMMSTSVITVSEDTDVDDVRALLLDRRISRVPVLSGQQLVGIISRSDIVRLLVMEWVCQVCGEPHRGETAPVTCPRCAAPQGQFAQHTLVPGD